MRIGIVTMPLCSNYGGILQNWALQKVLSNLGHEAITLRFPVMYQNMSDLHYWISVFPRQLVRYIANKVKGKNQELPITINIWRDNVKGIERFIDQHINVTKYLPSLSMNDVKRYGIEALVVGSDQIWRPVMYDALKYYFLGFTENEDILRIAYAPSIAVKVWPFNEELTPKIRQQIKLFDAISVREESSVKLVKDNLGVDAQWVLDPTMLVNVEEYLTLCIGEPQKLNSFVFAYILDMTEEKQKMLDWLSKELGCGIVYLTADKIRQGETIEKWLAYFRDASYVLTDSYHGTVFSLIFHKQFYCFYNPLRGNARMDSLKKISGLDNRFITRSKVTIDDDIDYTDVEKNIKEMRERSTEFLERALLSND